MSIPAWQSFLMENAGDLNVVLTTRHPTPLSQRSTEIIRANTFLRKFLPVNPLHQTGAMSGWLNQSISTRLSAYQVPDRPTTFTIETDRVDVPKRCSKLATTTADAQASNAATQIQSPTHLTVEATR